MSTVRPDFRFPRAHHLRTGGEFREVVRRGRRLQDEMFTVHAHQNGLQHARLGLTVSRRVALRANRRNRLKRLIRESFRHQQSQLKGLDIVVVARGPANKAEPSVIRSSLQQHWQMLQGL